MKRKPKKVLQGGLVSGRIFSSKKMSQLD